MMPKKQLHFIVQNPKWFLPSWPGDGSATSEGAAASPRMHSASHPPPVQTYPVTMADGRQVEVEQLHVLHDGDRNPTAAERVVWVAAAARLAVARNSTRVLAQRQVASGCHSR